MRLSPQILPEFLDVAEVTREMLNSATLYDDIYGCESTNDTAAMNNFAWLIDEEASLADFIDSLGQADMESENDRPLNLYTFYAAHNLKFPAGTVRLINEIRLLDDYVADMSSLLRAVTSSRHKYLQHAVFLDARRVPRSNLYALRRRILQEFIYLRMYLPVIIADSYSEADAIFHSVLYGDNAPRNVSVFGTKKSGKSTLINALLGDEYSPGSSELPTPCRITYSEAKTDGRIILEYGGNTYIFAEAAELRRYLTEEFRRASKTSSGLAEMRVTLPVLTHPAKLRGMSITDTPGTNFAAASGHGDIARSALADSENAIFVMNYSSHLSNDEAGLLREVYGKSDSRTLLIALNRIDEMYSAEVVKSYERAADYISSRLKALGYTDFLIVPVSALTGMYAEKVNEQVSMERGNLSSRLQRAADTGDNENAAVFLDGRLRERRRFYGTKLRTMRELSSMSRMKYMMHLLRYT